MPRPHDILRLVARADLLPTDAPEWAYAALRHTPWVVVRRARSFPGCVAVGVRGRLRAQRFATTVPHNVIERIVTPEELATVNPPGDRDVPALHALRAVRPHFDDTGMAWGPTGSVGFELATGIHTANAASDLDIVLRRGDINNTVLQQLSQLCDLLRAVPARVDCQVETPLGAIALAEFVSRPAQLLVRSAAGAHLIAAADIVR